VIASAATNAAVEVHMLSGYGIHGHDERSSTTSKSRDLTQRGGVRTVPL
jgi:hypothetical protein